MNVGLKIGCLVVLLLLGCNTSVTDIYISTEVTRAQENTFASIDEGLDKIIQLREEGNSAVVKLHIDKGEFYLSSSIKITPAHGSVHVLGAGLNKTTIKGSVVLANLKWEKYNDNIWKTQLNSEEEIDQLFINGEQQILARYPNYDENGGHWQGHAADAISKERVQKWEKPSGAIVHAMHSGEWGGFHYKATGVDSIGNLELEYGHQNNRPSKMHPKYRMVENVFEELDNAGEWFLEGKTLYYWPKNNIDLENAKIEGVVQKHLLEIIGSEERPVVNVRVDGIKFEHAKRTLFEEYEPLLRSDWTIYRGGAVFVEGTNNVNISNCEFSNLGGNVIMVSNYNRGTTITNNHIHNCGATAISFVGNPTAVRSPSFQYYEFVTLQKMDTVKGPKNNAYPSKAVVDNNLIHRIGRVEKQTAGVQIAMAMDISVSNNSIYDVPRAGINIGDGTWGGHILEYNDVFNTVLESGDHGAFNSWGRDRFWHPNRGKLNEIVAKNPDMPKWDAIHTTIIRNNRFRCDHGWDIDLDDGSSNYHIYNNLCLNGGIKLREGFYRTVENNIMLNNGFHPHVWFKNSEDVFRKNIVFTEHRDIRLDDWGKEVDYNFFPDETALEYAHDKGVDANSMYGDLVFADASNGNYDLKNDNPASKIGFKTFETDVYGVKSPELKAITKTPDFPPLYFGVESKTSKKFSWKNSELKNIETMAERSASGLNKTAGVLVVSVQENSIFKKSDIQAGDVIIRAEDKEIEKISDFISNYQKLNWKGKIALGVFRNQKEVTINLITK